MNLTEVASEFFVKRLTVMAGVRGWNVAAVAAVANGELERLADLPLEAASFEAEVERLQKVDAWEPGAARVIALIKAAEGKL